MTHRYNIFTSFDTTIFRSKFLGMAQFETRQCDEISHLKTFPLCTIHIISVFSWNFHSIVPHQYQTRYTLLTRSVMTRGTLLLEEWTAVSYPSSCVNDTDSSPLSPRPVFRVLRLSEDRDKLGVPRPSSSIFMPSVGFVDTESWYRPCLWRHKSIVYVFRRKRIQSCAMYQKFRADKNSMGNLIQFEYHLFGIRSPGNYLRSCVSTESHSFSLTFIVYIIYTMIGILDTFELYGKIMVDLRFLFGWYFLSTRVLTSMRQVAASSETPEKMMNIIRPPTAV